MATRWFHAAAACHLAYPDLRRESSSVQNAMRILELEQQQEAMIGEVRILAPAIGGPARRRLRASAGGSGVPGYYNVMVSMQQMLFGSAASS